MIETTVLTPDQRLECLRFALGVRGVMDEVAIVNAARLFESYILGEVGSMPGE